MKENNSRTKWLHLRLTEAEHQRIQKNFSKTTHTRLSSYARDILLGKPMIGSYRNQSLQDVLAELYKLRRDLHGVSNNFNQAVRKLHTLRNIPEFKSWIQHYDREYIKLSSSILDILGYIRKTADLWLRS
ncbi:plasmid mobilization protein [Sinomicrobium weinanense]|uniref:Plasmid mobilization relaxosome protein MobC n=1 Tax=Sinomicrobium weinanense TaxID=2842200 RepID=A0A926JT63_9FLAO|nr:plasmid mobilization relaxosome protein MobC [Sinomicrobium weinanense]MBC9797038.1 plasmid mobilization relaxosome protein MobC [Sinomicrobium weinanense]MBU3122033.1 plasmid mobilization relaxosome protein MobC [Sinomicrobium weinanense]